jgi:uncharacterized protein YbjT (DUF2867 family)
VSHNHDVEIAVAGATGSIGRPLAEELERRGHAVRRLSRRSEQHPVDLTTGAGLADALEGAEVTIDASNAGPSLKPAREVLIEGGGRLLEAARTARVAHHICISIVGIEHVPLPYYRVKVEQEQLVAAAEVPYTIVRATQFHTLIAQLFAAAGRFRVLPGGRPKLQSIDPVEAAAAIADTAESGPTGGRRTAAGPEICELGDLAEAWRTTNGHRALILPPPLPPKLGRALRSGALCDETPDHRGSRRFGDWLRQRRAG